MVSEQQYEQAYREQYGSCATCGKINIDGKPFIPDIGPRKDWLYGLLCKECHVMVAVCQDDPEHFMAIAKDVMRQMKDGHR